MGTPNGYQTEINENVIYVFNHHSIEILFLLQTPRIRFGGAGEEEKNERNTINDYDDYISSPLDDEFPCFSIIYL